VDYQHQSITSLYYVLGQAVCTFAFLFNK